MEKKTNDIFFAFSHNIRAVWEVGESISVSMISLRHEKSTNTLKYIRIFRKNIGGPLVRSLPPFIIVIYTRKTMLWKGETE